MPFRDWTPPNPSDPITDAEMIRDIGKQIQRVGDALATHLDWHERETANHRKGTFSALGLVAQYASLALATVAMVWAMAHGG